MLSYLTEICSVHVGSYMLYYCCQGCDQAGSMLKASYALASLSAKQRVICVKHPYC